jgi:hypothetical protein
LVGLGPWGIFALIVALKWLDNKTTKKEHINGKHPKDIVREQVADMHGAMWNVDINNVKTKVLYPCACKTEIEASKKFMIEYFDTKFKELAK